MDGYNCYYTGVLNGVKSDNKITAEMQSQAIVDLLNAGQADKPWKYKAGNYPVLSYDLLPVSVSSSAGGTLYAPPYASAGDEVVLFAVPDEGYELKTLQYNGNSIDGVSFAMPDGDVTVTAEFVPVLGTSEPEATPVSEKSNVPVIDAGTPEPSSLWIIILVAAAALVLISGGVWIIFRKKKQGGGAKE